MPRLLLVARHEYLRFARRKSFLLGIFAAPFFLLLIAGVGELSQALEENKTIGYLDHAGILQREVLALPAADDLDPDALVAYDDLAAGRSAVEDDQVDVLLVLEADYLQNRGLIAYSRDGEVSDEIQRTFGRFVQLSLASSYDSASAEQLIDGPQIRARSLDGTREMGPNDFIGFLLPFAAAFIFLMAGMTSAGYLLQAVSDEKENRTVEILTTSLSARELILGKAAGLVGITVTQLAVWGLGLLTSILVAARFVGSLDGLSVPWAQLALLMAFFVPAYLLMAAIMVAVGSAFPEFRQSQQLVAVINTLFFVPLFFVTLVWQDPDSPLALGLTLFPTTSFLAVPLRWSAGDVPLWQLAASWLILAASAAALLWAAPRIFRAGMLRYGQRLDLRASWRALWTGGR